MKLTTALIALFPLAFACGGPCKARSGQYLVKSTERPGGTCGPQPETMVDITPGPASAPNGCTQTATESDDKCDVSVSTTCPDAKALITAHWSPDGEGASGTYM